MSASDPPHPPQTSATTSSTRRLRRTRWSTRALAVALTSLVTRQAMAQATGTPPEAGAATIPEADAAKEAKDAKDVKAPGDVQRKASIEPKPALPPPPKTTFDSDPIADGAVIGMSLGCAGMLELINSTGEVRPQQVPRNFDRSKLLGIDRGTRSQTIDPNATTLSNLGLFAAIGFAVVDPIITGLREDSVQAGLVDAIIYTESISLTYALTNLAKVAVRRPRPNAYLEAEAHKDDPNYTNPQTDSALSFFSGHASITAAVGATATYLAFARAKSPVRPVVTLIVASAVAGFTSYERVRAGSHFPTDVVAGLIAGASVGILVPHLHRSEDVKQRRMWIGYAPVERGDGGTLHLGGLF